MERPEHWRHEEGRQDIVEIPEVIVGRNEALHRRRRTEGIDDQIEIDGAAPALDGEARSETRGRRRTNAFQTCAAVDIESRPAIRSAKMSCRTSERSKGSR